ncbi:MAG: hypothetical protein ACI32H_00645 [Bacilli bacterium]
MTIEEILEKLFSGKFKSINDINKIIEFIRNCKDKLILSKREIEIEEVLEYTREGKEPDLEVRFNNDEINIPHDFNSLRDAIIKNINPDLKELSLPISFLNDNLSFLEGLKSLTKLTINNYGFLTPEQLDFIEKHTGIKEIYFQSSYIISSAFENLVLMKKDGKYLGYNKGIIIREIETQSESINSNINKDKNNDIIVEAKRIAREDIDRILDLINEDLTKVNRKIEIKSETQKYVFNIIDGLVNMDIEDPDMNITSYIHEVFNKKGVKTNGVFIRLSLGYADKDYKELDKLSEEVEIRIRYRLNDTSSYDEFKDLRETMKWYRSIIRDYQLSPVEKLAFAYDILKTLEYNETEKEDKMESREPHKIVKTGHIVCAGYTSMLKEIFDEYDPNITIGSFGVTCYEDDDKTLLGYHSRAVAVIDDDKYGIHGVYALDPTWDSYKEKGKEKIDSDYTALDLYRYFMIPFSEYKKVFKHDSDINFFEGEASILNTDLSDENIDKVISTINRQDEQKDGELEFSRKEKVINYELIEILPEKSEQQVLELFKAKQIPHNIMMQIIRNVRLAEGYTIEQIDVEMEKVERIYDKTHLEIEQLTGKML